MTKKKKIHKATQAEVPVEKTSVETGITKQHLLILLGLLVAVIIAYIPAFNKRFINYDDTEYITQNPWIANFTFSSIPAIFSHFYAAQYSPIPSTIYGIIHLSVGYAPFFYNIFGIILHLVTIILVFKFTWSLCSNFRIAIVTAALFGVATLQVESVAWLAAVYKTCTYSIFFLLSLIVYLKYIKTEKAKFYIASILLFIISCFCKEQAVSLPLAIIAVDIFSGRKLFSKKVILEKLRFFAIAIVFGLVTMAASGSGGSEEIGYTSFRFIDRFIYIGYAVCTYIYKLFVPVKLSLYYPYFPLKNVRLVYMVFPLLMLIISGFYIWAIKRRNKFIVFGGLFFLINILFSLAVEIIAVRPTVMADRYVYLASVGIFFMVAYAGDVLIEKKLAKLQTLTIIFVSFFVITGFLTFSRVKVWRNSLIMWNDVISKYQSIPLFYYNRGLSLVDKNRRDEALDDFKKVIELDARYYRAYNEIGIILTSNNKPDEALNYYNKTIALKPDFEIAYFNRGTLYGNLKEFDKAIKDYSQAIKLRGDYAKAYYNRGLAEYFAEDKEDACMDVKKAVELGFEAKEETISKICQ